MAKVNWPVEQVEPEAVGMCAKRLERVGELVRRYVDEGKISGAITLAARRGKIAHLQCTGLADLEQKRPMTEDAIFRIYSMSKIVTSVATLMLMEDGHFLLKEPVKKWLPDFANLKVAVKGADGKEELVRLKRDITIHDLLTHLGGLSYDVYPEAREGGWTLEEFVRVLCTKPLKRQPGIEWDYSAATDVLGRLIEVVAGKPFDAFLKNRIFDPLGMTDTGFWVPPEKASRLPPVYCPTKAGGLEVTSELGAARYILNHAFKSGGGGLVATTSDYLRFALALVNHGEFKGVRLLSRKTIELMTQDNLPPGHELLDVNGMGFGLGVSVCRNAAGTKQLATPGEFGWGGAACTQAWIDPHEELVTMLMTQHRPVGPEKFPLMDLVKTTIYQSIID